VIQGKVRLKPVDLGDEEAELYRRKRRHWVEDLPQIFIALMAARFAYRSHEENDPVYIWLFSLAAVLLGTSPLWRRWMLERSRVVQHTEYTREGVRLWTSRLGDPLALSFRWFDVAEVQEHPGYLLFMLRDGRRGPVPEAAFENQEQRDLLIKLARHHLREPSLRAVT
jgi:hypothetical protein